MKTLLITFIFSTLFAINIAANEAEEQAKASLLYYVSELVEWPVGESVDSFCIGVLGHKPQFVIELQKMAMGKTISEKPIAVRTVGEYHDPDDIQILFVESSYHKNIANILGYCQKYHILQVTDRLENKLYTVINFVDDIDSNGVGIEVNKDNLNGTNLSYDKELLLFSNSLKDIRELYQTTKKLLESEAEKVVKLNEDIFKKNNELIMKNASIDSLSTQIDERKSFLAKLMETIEQQTHKISDQNNSYAQTRQQLLMLQYKQKEQLASIKEKESELNKLDSEIKEQQATIEKQSSTIKEKDSIIASINKVVLLLIILGSAIFIIGVLVYRAYRVKKRMNIVLEEKVDVRTQNLKETNKNLETEIIKRQKYEADLAKAEQRYREIYNATSDAILIHNLDGDVIDVNKAMLNMFGYSLSELKDLSLVALSSGEEKYKAKDVTAQIQNVIVNGPMVFDWRAKRKNGDVFWVEYALSRTNIGGMECLLSVVRDIHDKKQNEVELENYRLKLEKMVDDRTIELRDAVQELNSTNEQLQILNDHLETQKRELELAMNQLQHAQEQLVESEKMATIGIMAAGVAHEINNPLNYIKGGVSGIKMMLEEQYSEEDNIEISELMMGVDMGVERASKIVSSLNHFSRQSETLNEKCDIHAIIENCLELLHHTLKNRIQVEKDYNHIPLFCLGNEGKIHQVLLNILTNAAQAIEGTGNIAISTGKLEDNRIFIQVCDSGSGIKAENIDKITTPFFTTKEPGQGTGLGLAITKKIINDHQGELVFDSKEGEGTSVYIYLPHNIS